MSNTRLYPFVLAACLLTPVTCFAEEQIHEQLRVFSLVHADCKTMLGLLDDLSEGELTMGVDPRTNSLIVKGDPQQFELIGALLMKLDQPVKGQKSAQKSGPKSAQKSGEKKQAAPSKQRKVPQTAKAEAVARMAIATKLAADQKKKSLAAKLRQHEMHLNLVRRKLEMAKAKAELELESLKAELAVKASHLDAMRVRSAMIRDQVESGTASTDELGMAAAEVQTLELEIAMDQRRIQFHEAHVMPMVHLEHESEIMNAEAALQEIHGVYEMHMQPAIRKTKTAKVGK